MKHLLENLAHLLSKAGRTFGSLRLFFLESMTQEVVKDSEGKIIFFSPTGFYKNIILKKGCFVCGMKIDGQLASKEHILPNWFLKYLDIHKAGIKLPNGQMHQYGTYTIPCCIDCNKKMGRDVEDPISVIIKAGYEAVSDHVKKNGHFAIYTWLAGIFLKTHLKDKDLKMFVDHRKGFEKIGEHYKWEGLYLASCFSRAFYTDTKFDFRMVGSFFLFQVADNQNDLTKVARYHYMDDTSAQVLMFQIKDIGLIAAFNDYGMAECALEEMKKRIASRPVNRAQLAEFAAHVAMVSHLRDVGPELQYSAELNEFKTSAPPKGPILKKVTPGEWGHHLVSFVSSLPECKELHEDMEKGLRTFLWNEDGTFRTGHLE